MATGILLVVAIGLVTYLLLFLHPSHGDAKQTIRVRFTNIDKIAVGTPVTFAGQPVGDVVKIQILPDARTKEAKGEDDVYSYELTLAVDSKTEVFDTDEIAARTSGLMGEKSVAILPRGTLNDATAHKITSNDILYATSSGSVEDTFTELQKVVKKAELTMDEVIEILDENQDDVQRALNAIEGAGNEMQKLFKRANDTDLIATVSSLSEKLDNTASKLDIAMQEIEDKQLVHHFTEATQRLNTLVGSLDPKVMKNIMVNSNEMLTNLNSVITQVSKGEGTLGKFLVDKDLYLKSVAVLNKANIIMNDMNQYGVLFHLDKGWQRDRRKKIEELARLESPVEFKNYLNQEMQNIALSMERLNMAMEKADKERQPTASDEEALKKEYTQAIAELMGQVQDLQSTLKDYCEVYNNKKEIIAENTKP